MKNKGISILLIITNIVLIIMLCSFISINGNIVKEKQIIKEMSESTQVADLNNQINSLNAEHTEYMNYIQTCKTKIATALTNEGVTTSNEATLETMAENISKVLQARTKDATATADNIAKGYTAYVNGKLITGRESTVDIAINKEYMCFPISISGSFTAEQTIGDYSFLALGGISTVSTDFSSSTIFSQNSVSVGDNRTKLRTTQVYVAYCKTNVKQKYLVEQVTISDGKAPSKDEYILLDLLRTGSVGASQGRSASNNYVYNKITGECTNATYYAIYVKI